MSRKLTASDRSALIRLASAMPVGSEERKAILKGLSKSAPHTKAAGMTKLTIEVDADRDRVSDTFPSGQPYVEFDGRERYYLVSPPGSSRGGKYGEWRNAYGAMPMEAVLPLVAFMYGK